MMMKRRRTILLIGLVLVLAVVNSQSFSRSLKHDPFKKPEFLEKVEPQADTTPESKGRPIAGELRATITAGAQSMANVDGVILTLGEEMSGYRLIEVREREAVFVRHGKREVLTID